MNLPIQSTASSDHHPTWSDTTLKKIKARKQRVYDCIKDRDQFTNLAMEMVLENTSFQRVFRVLFESQVTLFNETYQNFWELGLQKQNITNYKFTGWDVNPPQLLDNLDELSEFPLCIERSLTGDKPLKVSLPFVPKFIEYKEISRLYILDNTEAWFTGESLVLNKIPMTDVFTFKQCFIIKALSDTKVQVQFRWFVDFHKWTPFKGTVMSQTKDEINFFNSVFFKPALENAIQTGVFVSSESDIFKPKSLAVKEPQKALVRESKRTNSPKHHIRENFVGSPAKPAGETDEVVDPREELANSLLREIESRNQTPAATESILQRLYRPKYKGDFIFISMMILSLANLSRVIFF